MDSVQDPSDILDMLKEWKNMGDNVVKSLMDGFSGIDSREKNLSLREEKLDEKLREVEFLRRQEVEKSKGIEKRERESVVVKSLLERRLDEVREKLKEFEALRNGRLEEVGLREESLRKKEKELELKNQKLLEELAVREESLCEKEREFVKKLQQLALKEEALCKLKLANEKLLEEVCLREVGWRKEEKEFELKKQIELKKQKLLEELDVREEILSKKEIEFEEKLQQLSLKGEGLCKLKLASEKLLLEVSSRAEGLCKKEKELELANKKLAEEISLREEGLCKRERELEQTKQKLLMEVSLREEGFRKKEKEFELANEKLLEEVAAREESVLKKNFDFLNQFKLANEKLQEKQKMGNALLERLDSGIDMIRGMKTIMDDRLKEIEYREKMAHEALTSKLNEANAVQELLEKRFKELEDLENQNHPQQIVPDEGPRTLQKDLEAFAVMLIHSKKDLELMQTEIRKILTISPEPAKLALETVKECHGILLGKKLRGIVIMLDVLTKMCPKIENCVRREAGELASQWFSKLSAGGGDEMELLGFLHLVPAFDLSSRFAKKEMLRLLQMVGGHEHKAELCHNLGLTKMILGHIHNLMSQKEYLLASIYTHEYQLQHKLRQKTIINKYIAHSQKSAKTQATNQGNTCEAKEKAIAGEIADLRAALAHITKYGLKYSTKFLLSKIQRLKADKERLKHESPLPLPPPPPNSRYDSPGWRAEHQSISSPIMGSYVQMPCQSSDQHAYSMGMHPVDSTADFSYPLSHVGGAPMPHPGPNGPYKRHRSNDWSNGNYPSH